MSDKNKRLPFIQVTLSQETKDKLTAKAKKEGFDVSGYIRMLIFNDLNLIKPPSQPK